MTGRFIILSNPALCIRCGKLLRKGRGAFWDAGSLCCVVCVRKAKGEAPIDQEERDLIDEYRADKEEGKGKR